MEYMLGVVIICQVVFATQRFFPKMFKKIFKLNSAILLTKF